MLRFIKRNLPIVIASLGLIALIVGIALSNADKNSNTSKTPTLKVVNKADLIAGHTFVMGSPDAPIEVVIFTDFMSEEDRAYIKGAIAMAQQNPKYVRVAIRPGKFEEMNKTIATSLQVAGDEGSYRELLTKIAQTNWGDIAEIGRVDTKLENLIKEIGGDVTNIEEKRKEKHYKDLLKIDEKDAHTLRITRTPTIYLDGDLREFSSPEIFIKYLEERIRDLREKDYEEKRKTETKGQQALEDIPESTDIIRRLVLRSKPEELTTMQKERQKTPLKIKFSAETGWDPTEARAVRGQKVIWHNPTGTEIHIRALDTVWSGLEKGFTLPANGTFEYTFDQKGLFRYEEKETYFWGVVIIE